MMKSPVFFGLWLGLATAALGAENSISTALKFNFNADKSSPGVQQVWLTTIYIADKGFGYEPESIAGKPLLFSVKLPEGNYDVTLKFGAATSATTNTIKAELRRLMLENVTTPPGEFVTRTFTVNIRTPQITAGSKVKLKGRELVEEVADWDDKLTLEFNGGRPGVAALEIAPTAVAPTIFVAGDSTVCDQPSEPWNSWGQMLPRFFAPGIAVANYAESGESVKSSLGARRFDKIFSRMQKGDWLLIQFGHNDMKDKAPNALAVYKANLKKLVAQTRAHGATPVLITSMERKGGVEKDTLAGYPETVRAVAAEEKAALIDLHAMSKVFYRALGPDLAKAFQDGTHHNNYGSYELARCIVEGIRESRTGLEKYLAPDAGHFNPAHPDSVATFAMAVSGTVSKAKPEGN